MKQVIVSAVVAAIVSVAVLVIGERLDDDDMDEVDASGTAASAPVNLVPSSFSVTDELIEDVWVNGARSTGSDRRSLSSAETSVCVLTKVELKGIQSAQDSNSCALAVDDFTGFWELIVTVEEGGQSEIRCNARCLSWE